MSQEVYVKLVSHIVADSEESVNASQAVISELNALIKSVYGTDASESSWRSFSHIAESGTDRITAEFCEVLGGQPPYIKIEEILSVIDKLNNGSYGMLLADTDYGIMRRQTFGNAEFTEIPAEKAAGYAWSTGDLLCMEKKVSASFLAGKLDCPSEAVCDEAEYNYEELADKLVPSIVKEICPEISFVSCEVEEDYDDDNVNIRFLMNSGSLSTEQLLKLQTAFTGQDLNDYTLRLSESADNEGVYENVMICPENNSSVIWSSSNGKIGNITFSSLQEK